MESRGIALLFLTSALEGRWGVSVTPRPHLTPGKDPVFIVQEAGWASGPVWIGVENLAPTGIRSPDRPARRQSLYRLSYPSQHIPTVLRLINVFKGVLLCTTQLPGNQIQLILQDIIRPIHQNPWKELYNHLYNLRERDFSLYTEV